MILKGAQLIFISQINRDGKGVTDKSNEDMSHIFEEDFEINSLSITQGTFIASQFNSYVVKIKNLNG